MYLAIEFITILILMFLSFYFGFCAGNGVGVRRTVDYLNTIGFTHEQRAVIDKLLNE